MKRYVALLRGVNISGKSKVDMKELADLLRSGGFSDVRTYLNSGNAVFSAEETEEAVLSDCIRRDLAEKTGISVPVHVISQERLKVLLSYAPEWWGSDDKAIYDNLIFVMPGMTAEELKEKIGEPTGGLERIWIHEDVIFWSFDRQKYAKANWWKKTADAGIGEHITIRTANTVRKLASM